MFDTKGVDILQVIKEAKENGNTDFAELVEKQIENVQLCYDIIAQKYTATGGNMWQIDANYLKSILNK